MATGSLALQPRALGGRELVGLVNYANQRSRLKDFFECFEAEGRGRVYAGQIVELASGSSNEMNVFVDDILAHFNYTGELPPARDDKLAGMICTLLYNGPRAARLCYEIVEEKIAELQGDTAPTEDALLSPKAKIWNVIRKDKNIPAMYRVPYTLHLIAPRRVREQTRPLHELRGNDVGHTIELRGLVSRVSAARPSIYMAVYRCEACNRVRYHHVESYQFLPLKNCEKDSCLKKQNTLVISQKDSKYVNYQEVWIQELPQNVPRGKVPHQLKIVVSGSLSNKIRPGRQVRIGGFFVIQWGSTNWGAPNAGAFAGGDHLPIFDAQYVEEDDGNLLADDNRIQHIQKQAQYFSGTYQTGLQLYEMLASCIAPTIHGHDDVKKALLLQIVGGAGREERESVKLRGTIHILLLGDPGIAKSQLLLRMCELNPRSKYTCGKGASGVGLTACVSKDQTTGEFTLEAGATVLADKGLCCIDEFDKMDEFDRTAVHEVMEQQSVSISKAGIVATLNARCSILAAANPVGGRYNVQKSAVENIGLPAALLSRFDLIFLMLDEGCDRDRDMAMARHLLNVRRCEASEAALREATSGILIETDVIRYLVEKAKTYQPILPKALQKDVTERYMAARRESGGDSEVYITARSLTALLRLSQALAKLRFDNEITLADIEEAQRLVLASKESVRTKRMQMHTANVDMRFVKAKNFILKQCEGRRKASYDDALQLAAEQGFDPAIFNDALEDMIRQGHVVYTDITKAHFVQIAR